MVSEKHTGKLLPDAHSEREQDAVHSEEGQVLNKNQLYYTDSYRKTFSSVIQDCRQKNGRWELQLAATLFYPEGGGQPGDQGYLYLLDPITNEEGIRINISDTHEKDGIIWHTADRPASPGTLVNGTIDWDYRFSLMQNHSGEHIVSGLIHEKYGYDNVGFHMGSDVITIDLSGELTMDQLREIEDVANRIIWQNLEVDIRVMDETQAEKLEFRSKKELHGDVRIVTFPGADCCACCGLHVRRTGEIGLIRILNAERFHDGVRVEMLSGERAFCYTREESIQNRQISTLLSAKVQETAGAVLHLKETSSQNLLRAMELEKRMISRLAQSCADQGNTLFLTDILSSDGLRKLTDEAMKASSGICAVFNGNDQDGYRVCIGQAGGQLKEFTAGLFHSLNGRGGGKPFFVQGSVQADKEAIMHYFETFGESWKMIEF